MLSSPCTRFFKYTRLNELSNYWPIKYEDLLAPIGPSKLSPELHSSNFPTSNLIKLAIPRCIRRRTRWRRWLPRPERILTGSRAPRCTALAGRDAIRHFQAQRLAYTHESARVRVRVRTRAWAARTQSRSSGVGERVRCWKWPCISSPQSLPILARDSSAPRVSACRETGERVIARACVINGASFSPSPGRTGPVKRDCDQRAATFRWILCNANDEERRRRRKAVSCPGPPGYRFIARNEVRSRSTVIVVLVVPLNVPALGVRALTRGIVVGAKSSLVYSLFLGASSGPPFSFFLSPSL